MVSGIEEDVGGNTRAAAQKARANATGIAARGVKTSRDFAAVMSSLMSDILEERVEPRVANAVCNAAGKLLKIVELEHKYGAPSKSEPERLLRLAE